MVCVMCMRMCQCMCVPYSNIEYCWGKVKFQFRRYTNTESPNYNILDGSVRIAMGAKEYRGEDGLTHRAPLPLSQVRMCVWKMV